MLPLRQTAFGRPCCTADEKYCTVTESVSIRIVSCALLVSPSSQWLTLKVVLCLWLMHPEDQCGEKL